MASPTNIKLPKVAQYAKNVGKSVAFASINSVKGNMPGMKDFLDENNEIFRDIYGSAKNYRETLKKMDRNIRNSNIYKAIEYGAKNMIEDAKTGNFYTDRTYDNAESILGIDDDMDFEYEVSSNDTSVSSSKYLSDSFDRAIGAAAIGTTTAVAQGTDMIIRSTKASTTLISSQIEKSTATLHSGLGAVYNSVNNINQFLNGPMMAHLENSRTYYDNSLRIMQEQQAMMREMLEMQRNLYKAQSASSRVSKIDQSMDYNGNVNLRGYAKTVKGNISDLMDSYGLNMFGKDSGVNIPMMIAAAPFKLMLDTLADSLMPKNIKRNLNNFDKALSSVFSQFITKMNKNKNNAGASDLMYLLGNIFGIDIERKDKINTSNYNKGAVPFDGITRKTIIEVIPGYLARIEAALTGQKERHYDPHRGTWRSIDDISTSFKAEKMRAIQSANRDITNDLYDYRSRLSKKDAEALDKSVAKMMTKIFEDGGLFEPMLDRDRKTKYDSRGRRTRTSSGEAWKEYGFRNKKEFDTVLSQMSDATFYSIARNNMNARQNYSRSLEQYEMDGGVYNLLFNDSYASKNKNKSSSGLGGRNMLTALKDEHGKNVFYYLREILKSINNRWNNGGSNSGGYIPKPVSPAGGSSRESHTSSTESEGDSGSDDDDSWERARLEIEEEERRKYEDSNRKRSASRWISEKFDKSPIGRFFAKAINGFSDVFARPIAFTDELLQKANENVFAMMFGNKELKDENGNEITNVLEYMINKIKNSFDELTKWIRTKLKDVIDPLWAKMKPKVQPVIDELKSIGRAAGARVKRGLNNTFGKAFDSVIDRLPPELAAKLARKGVVTADEVEDYEPFQDNEEWYGNIIDSARGRYVTKRGLTMISPGEIIIPASFDKKKQKKMLALEKRDRNRILKGIGLNAEGNVDTERIKKQLHGIYEENKGTNKSAKNIASGIVGAGAGLLTGLGPLLGALAGVGISVLNNSDTLKNIVFGTEINGERQGGIVSKKIQDRFKEVMPDMGDYGIAGGVLGLFTPFGVLGGAAIGAGIGYLKHSEGFKKFIFGDEATGEEGLISKEAYEKFKSHVKKAAPNMLIGAAGGILAGPFGLLGNAALGAGIGLISTTETFHDFVFGNPEKGTAGVLDAFKTGFLDPAKEKFVEFIADFKRYARRNIIEPMKNFWKPVNQMLKNTIHSVGEKISDHLNDMFERTLGLPLHDFLQEKVFKPIGKVVFGILKAPYTVGKAIVAAPFRALGGIGNTIRASQIRRGTAYDMSASERLAWRDQHWLRFNKFNRWNDKNLEQDRILLNMTDDQLAELSMNARSGLDSYATLQKRTGSAKKALSQEISGFFNTKTEDGKNRFNRVKYDKVNELTEVAQSGSLTLANKYINELDELTDAEKIQLKNLIKSKVQDVGTAEGTMRRARRSTKELDKELSNLIGRKFKGRSDRRQLYKNAEAELAARRKANNKANESPEVNATNNFAEIYQKKSDSIISHLVTANKYLQNLVNPNQKDTRPPGDKKAEVKEQLSSNDGNSNIESNKSKQDTKVIEEATKTIEDKKKKKNPVGKYWNGMIGGALINPDSKKAVDFRKKKAEDEQEEAENLQTNKDQVSILTSIKEAIIGKKENTEPTGFFGKLMQGIGKFGKFIGMTGLTLVGVSLFGHATEWFKTSIWPHIKSFLFGTTDSDGNVLKEGLVGKISSGVKKAMFGEDGTGGIVGGFKKLLYGENGNDGVLAKAGNWITKKIDGIAEWFKSKGGFKGLFINDIIPGFINGLGYAINNLVTPVSALLFKALPSLLAGLGKALLQGFKIAIFNSEVPNNRMSINDGGASNELDKAVSNINSTIEGSDKSGVVTNIKGAFGNLKAAFAADTSIDFSSIFPKDGGKNNVKSDGIMGALGQTRRTNEIEYDENGNIITDYVRWNTTDSVLSKIGKASGRAFWKGLTGNVVGKAAANVGTDMISSAATLLRPGKINTIKGIVGMTTSAAKGALNTVSTAGRAGTAVNKAIDRAAYTGKFLKGTKNIANKVADDAAEKVAKTGILSGIKNIFKEIGNSSICTKIAKYASNMTNNKVTEKIVKEALEKIGDKLGKTIIGKVAKGALTGAANVIAKFSPLSLLTFAADFLWGFDNAYTILGLTEDTEYNVNLGLKCVCGLTNMLTNFLTLGIIPADIIMDIVIEYILPIFGLSTDGLEEARNLAQAELDAWNKAHPDETYDNIQDFNNKDKWWYKANKYFQNAWKEAKTATSEGIEAVKNGFSTMGDNISDWFTEFIKSAKILAPLIDNASINHVKKAWDWDNSQNIDDSLPTTGNDALDKIGNTIYGVAKVIIWPATALGNAIGAVKNGINSFTSAASGVLNIVKNGINNTLTKANNGSLSGISSWLTDSTGNKVLDTVANVVFGVSKIFTTPIALFTYSVSNLKTSFGSIINKWSTAQATKKSDDTKIANALNGKLSVFSSNYWKNADHTKEGILGAIVNVQTYIEKLLNAPVAIVQNIISSVTSGLNKIKALFNNSKSLVDIVVDFFNGNDDDTTTNSKSGKGRLFGRAHSYQSSRELSNIPYGDSTIGESGCAPVAAANLLGGSVRDAARFAEMNGMTVPGGGTDIQFFNSYLGSKGIVTRNTNSRSGVMNALTHGNQVIMLGQDGYDNGAPFGTNPHFITAKGISPNGNIIAEDPDLPNAHMEYRPNDVMNSMISSVIVGQGKRFGRKRGLFGKGQSEYDMLVNYGSVSSPYGMRNGSMHKGVDLYAYNNAPIHAFTDGTVKYTEGHYAPDSGHKDSKDGAGFGNYVTLKDSNGYYHVYAHMNGTSVSVGDSVSMGDKIGIQGHTGRSTGSHLHYQVTSGSPSGTSYDPYTYLKNYTRSSSSSSASDVPEDDYDDYDDYDDSSSSNSSSSSDSSSSSSDTETVTNTSNSNPTFFTALTNLGKSIARYFYGSAFDAIYGNDTNTTITNPDDSSSSSDSDSSSSSDDDYEDDDSSSDSPSTDNGNSSNNSSWDFDWIMTESARNYWNTLKSYGFTNAGTAGIMGNINCESKYLPNNVEDGKGYTDDQYTSMVNDKTYSKSKFTGDNIGYGLFQTTSEPLKTNLYKHTIEAGSTVNNPYKQIASMVDDLNSRSGYYNTRNILQSTNDINTASDQFGDIYENPKAEEWYATKQKRRDYSWAAYNKFASGSGRSDSTLYGGHATKALNNYRSGYVTNNTYYGMARNNGVDYTVFLKTIVEILISISNNTVMLNKIVEILSSKFNINIDPNAVSSATSNANSRAQVEREINRLIEANSDLSSRAKLINNKDTSYLLSAMTAIAAE